MPATRFFAPGLARLKAFRPSPKAGDLAALLPSARGLLKARHGSKLGALAAALLLTTACLVLALADTAQAATSETCLRRCLGVCADKGQAGSEACLRPCLQDCPVHCGTVDADCALACVTKAGEAAGETAGTPAGERAGLAARCAGACTVMADCRPSAYDNGPADLFPATPAPHVRKRPQ